MAASVDEDLPIDDFLRIICFVELADITLNEGALNEDPLRVSLPDASRCKLDGDSVPRHIVPATTLAPNLSIDVVRLGFSFGFFTFPLTRTRDAK